MKITRKYLKNLILEEIHQEINNKKLNENLRSVVTSIGLTLLAILNPVEATAAERTAEYYSNPKSADDYANPKSAADYANPRSGASYGDQQHLTKPPFVKVTIKTTDGKNSVVYIKNSSGSSLRDLKQALTGKIAGSLTGAMVEVEPCSEEEATKARSIYSERTPSAKQEKSSATLVDGEGDGKTVWVYEVRGAYDKSGIPSREKAGEIARAELASSVGDITVSTQTSFDSNTKTFKVILKKAGLKESQKKIIRQLIKEQLHVSLKEDNVDEAVSPGFTAGLIAALVAGAAGVKAKQNFDDFKRIMHKVETQTWDYDKLSSMYQQDTGKTPEQGKMDATDLKIYAAAKELQLQKEKQK